MADLPEGIVAMAGEKNEIVDEGRMSLPKVMLSRDGQGQHAWTQLIAILSGQSFKFPLLYRSLLRRVGEACSGTFWLSLIALGTLK